MGPDTRLSFLPLSVVPDGGEFLVGHAESGTFVSLPDVGVQLIQALQQGQSVADIAASMAQQGIDVDVADFAAAMVDVGLARVGEAPLPSVSGGLGLPVAGRWAAPLFSRFAWACYGLAAFYSAVLLALQPDYRPAMTDFFFHPHTGLSLAVMMPVSWLVTCIHELFHGLAGRAAGVPVRFGLGRRLFIPVLETDLSALWAVPRNHRYGPFLAGMAWDGLVLAISLTMRLLADSGYAGQPVARFAAAMALVAFTNLTWQWMIFFRTDLYAVMVNWLGCRNLYRTTYLSLKAKLLRLAPGEEQELAGAAPRDLQAARWFAWLYLFGLGWAVYYLIGYFLPGIRFAGGWAVTTLVTADPGRLDFWLAIVIGAFVALQVLWPTALYMRKRNGPAR